MYIGFVLSCAVDVQVHGMFRRTSTRVLPPLSNPSEYRLADVAIPKFSAKAVQAPQQAWSKGQQGFSSKLMETRAAAAAKNQAFRQAFAASRARMGDAINRAKIPLAAGVAGLGVGAVGMTMYHKPDKDALESQIFALNQALPEIGEARQESIWRSMFDIPYAEWLQILSREELEEEYTKLFEEILMAEDIAFQNEQARIFKQNSSKKYFEKESTFEKRISKMLELQNQAVRDHWQKQQEVRNMLDNIGKRDSYELIDEMRLVKPNFILDNRKRQQEERLRQTYFPEARQKLVNIIRP